MMKMLKKVAIVAAIGVLSAVLAACNTVEGVGKDVEDAGEGIQRTAD